MEIPKTRSIYYTITYSKICSWSFICVPLFANNSVILLPLNKYLYCGLVILVAQWHLQAIWKSTHSHRRCLLNNHERCDDFIWDSNKKVDSTLSIISISAWSIKINKIAGFLFEIITEAQIVNLNGIQIILLHRKSIEQWTCGQ